jgi:hypothetical protein
VRCTDSEVGKTHFFYRIISIMSFHILSAMRATSLVYLRGVFFFPSMVEKLLEWRVCSFCPMSELTLF